MAQLRPPCPSLSLSTAPLLPSHLSLWEVQTHPNQARKPSPPTPLPLLSAGSTLFCLPCLCGQEPIAHKEAIDSASELGCLECIFMLMLFVLGKGAVVLMCEQGILKTQLTLGAP